MLKRLIAVSLLALAVTGCSTVATVGSETEAGRTILNMEAPADGAALYLYRDRSSHFGLFHMLLQVDGKNVELAPACLARIELKPGTYHLEADHPDVFGFEQEVDLTVDTGDVKVYEFKPISRFVVPGESKLIPRDSEGLRRAIDQQKLCTQDIVRL